MPAPPSGQPASPNRSSRAPSPEPFAHRVGEASTRALGVALLGAIPAALRTAGAGGSLSDGLLVSTAVLVPFVAAGLLLSHAAGRGFRYLALGRSPRGIALGLALWIGLAL